MEFKEYRFDEVTINFDKKRVPISGAQRKKRQGKYRYYGAQGIIDYIDDFIFDGTYLLIAEDGENLKSQKQKIAQVVDGQFWVNNHAHIVQGNELCDTRYLCYLLNSMDLSGYITGSAQPKLSQANLNSLILHLPSIREQRTIVEYLYMFDKKISVNQQINDNLYTQMRTLTKQWVIENASDYELLPLAKIASINPDTYSPKEEWEYVNYLDTSSITDGYIAEIQHITPSTEKLPSRARRKIALNDVVFSTVRPNQRHFGILSEPMSNMLGSTGFAVIRSNNPLVCNELIYLCLTENEFIEKMQQLAEQSTSTFPSIKPSDLGVCEIPCPKDDASKSFFEMLKSMFALIAENQRENISLATIRDTLLPKLMCGALDVSNIQF